MPRNSVALAHIGLALGPFLTAAAGCSSPASSGTTGPKVLTVSTRVEVSTGLANEDYVTFGVAGDQAVNANAAGEGTAQVYEEVPGTLFSVPAESSASAQILASESGIYLSPYLGFGQGIVLQGTSYAVAKGEPIIINATTTLLSMLMMHPDLSHPAADVATAEAQYLVTRINGSWPTLTACAQTYDSLLSVGSDPTASTDFATCLQASLDEVRAGMTAPTASVKRDSSGATTTASIGAAQLAGGDRTTLALRNSELAARKLLSVTTGDSSALSPSGVIVSAIAASKSGNEVLLNLTTHVGTGLDYLYSIRRLPSNQFPQGKTSASFISPVLQSNASSASIAQAGFVPASSYFSYLDVVGNSLNWIAKSVGSVTTLADDGKIHLSINEAGVDYYELRLFSGGYGLGDQAIIGQYALDNYATETSGAFRHNVASAIVEHITLVPGADVLLGEDTLGVVVQEATTQAVTGLEQIYSTTGAGGLDGTAVYNLLYGIAQTAVTKYIDEASKKAQVNGVKKFIQWVGWGGKKVAKLVLAIPAKAAKGGSLANRAFRLSNPESTMELWYLAIGDEGDLEVVSGSDHVMGTNTDSTCVFSGDLSWTVRGISPTRLTDLADYYQYSVKGNTSGSLSLSVTNADCTPHAWSTSPGTSYPTQYREYTVESTARVESSCTFSGATYDMSGTPNGDVTRDGAFTASGFEGSFTLPSPAHENDFPHVSVTLAYDPIVTEKTYEISEEGAIPTLVSTRTGLRPAQGEVGGPIFYFNTFTVEAK